MTRRRWLILGVPALLPGGVRADTPRRIVSLSPAVTEILYGIGAFDRVVAVTEYCLYPPEAKALPKVGGWSTPSVERIVGFRPDLVILSDAQRPFIKSQLDQLGIATAVVRSQTVADALGAIETLGRATGTERQAADLVARTKASLEAVRHRALKLPHPTVVCIIDRTPGTLRDLYAAMRGTFLAELIDVAGGKVTSAATQSGYGRLSTETLLTLAPEAILDVEPESKGSFGGDLLAAWRELPELRAVRDRRVYVVRQEFVPHASQMIARTAALFARLLHPEVPEHDWETR